MAPGQLRLITSLDIILATEWHQFTAGVRTKNAFMSAAAESSFRQLTALCLAFFIVRHQPRINLLEFINANNSGINYINIIIVFKYLCRTDTA